MNNKFFIYNINNKHKIIIVSDNIDNALNIFIKHNSEYNKKTKIEELDINKIIILKSDCTTCDICYTGLLGYCMCSSVITKIVN